MHYSSVWLEYYTADTGNNPIAVHTFSSGYSCAIRWLIWYYIPAHLYKLLEFMEYQNSHVCPPILLIAGLTD